MSIQLNAWVSELRRNQAEMKRELEAQRQQIEDLVQVVTNWSTSNAALIEHRAKKGSNGTQTVGP